MTNKECKKEDNPTKKKRKNSTTTINVTFSIQEHNNNKGEKNCFEMGNSFSPTLETCEGIPSQLSFKQNIYFVLSLPLNTLNISTREIDQINAWSLKFVNWHVTNLTGSNSYSNIKIINHDNENGYKKIQKKYE